jgi:hypothetical protein
MSMLHKVRMLFNIFTTKVGIWWRENSIQMPLHVPTYPSLYDFQWNAIFHKWVTSLFARYDSVTFLYSLKVKRVDVEPS